MASEELVWFREEGHKRGQVWADERRTIGLGGLTGTRLERPKVVGG